MRAPRCWRQLLAIVLVAIILPAPVNAIAPSIDEPASIPNEAGDSAASDQQSVNREPALRPPISASTARRIHRSTG